MSKITMRQEAEIAERVGASGGLSGIIGGGLLFGHGTEHEIGQVITICLLSWYTASAIYGILTQNIHSK